MFVDPNNLFPIGGCLLMMLFNTIFLWQLTFIISALFPKDGSPSMTMYEFLFGKKINKQPFAFFDYQDSGMNVFVSKEQATGDVRLRHCTKIYSTTGERALDSLTFTARHGEITTLIGHNGAGKSTTFGVLSGMTSLSSGRIYVGKDNLIKNFDKYRSLIGYCPQHDAFFPHLTVFEQIYLIILNKIVNDEINSYLERLNLEDVKDKKPFILPKGTSRKVSLAMALGGNSKILLLDEPRTSMDIDSNMEINVLLKDIKKEKTIILATHILDDEAYISDKMIFLSKGRVAASGTWKELMKRFAPGYILNIQYKNNSIDNIKETVKIIQYMMPIATINSTSKVNEASFLLPTKENIECVELIQTLENKAKDLQICDYQLLKTTFKDAYLKMDHMADMSNESMNLACNAKKFANEICGEKKKKIKRNLYLFYRQVAALLRKHRIYFDNHWLQFLLQSALPISILVFKLYFASDTTLTKFYQGVKFDSNYMAPFILPYYIKNSSSLYHLNDEVLVKRNIDNIKSIIQTQYNSSKRITIIENHGTDNKALTEKYLKYFLSKEQLGYGFELQNPLDTSDVVIRFNNIAIHSIMISMVEYFKIFKDLHIEASIKVLSPPGINGSVLTMNDKSYMEKNYETMPWLLDFETDGAFVFMSLVLYGILHTSHSIIFLIEERISHFKHQQLSANISKKCFYLCNLLFNLMTFSGGLIIIMFTLVTGFKSLLSWHSVICFSIIMIGYYISNAPFIWMMSGMFHTPLKGYIFMIVFQFLFPCFFFILSFVVIMFFHSVLPMQGLTLIGFFSPSGCLIFHLTEIAGYMTYNDFNYYEQTFGVLFVVQILRGICTYMLFWIIEDDYIQFYYHRKIKKYLKSMKTLLELLNFKDKSLTISDESTDLINTNDEIVAVNLGKKYKKCYLLKNVTFNVGKNECFCFIGSNGAGKTLIFDILTKRTYATEGSYYIKGIQLNRNQARIGYCQQKDSFMPEYTIEDLMIIFATLLGYVNVDEIVNEIVECFGLEKHRYKYFKNLSGGQKKRLSMSIAILAGEDILLLDEPTSSVDPKSRRFIWDFLEALKGLNRTILISTHNITECEYLANKIGFFKKDSSFDVGTIDFVKHLFSNRYIVSITLENPTMDNWIEVQNKMIEIFECLPINLRSIRRTNEWKVSANNEIRTWLDIYNTVVKIVEYFNSMDENNNNENTDDEGNDEDEKNIEVTRPIITTFDVSNCSFDKALYEYIVKNDALSV
uniref:ABC transporter domain-containing protein n=1 Tax=Parastrongyloides trichosuri TaxID=131310 RepID=A0A0N4Z9T0_PARTI